MELTNCTKTKEQLVEEYNNLGSNERRMLECSYSTVSDTMASENRLEEIRVFCKKMGFRKVGVAFCKGVRDFGIKADESLSRDFTVYSVCCNVCGIEKSGIKVKHIKEGATEMACNPIGQADAINSKDVDFVIKCGFCLGHDILFSKRIKAPATTLLVKDRKLKHKTAEIFSK